MPEECKYYDCRRYEWSVIRIWMNGKWKEAHCNEIPPGFKLVIEEIETKVKPK